MAENLLEEIEGDEPAESVEDQGEATDDTGATADASATADAAATGEEADNGAGEKKGLLKKLFSGKKKLIILLLLVLLLLGGVGGGVLFFMSGGEQEEVKEEPVAEDVVTEESIQAALADQTKVIFEDIVQLEPFEQIFLKQSSRKQYISLGIALEMMDPGLRRQVYTMEPRIRKIIESQMRQMTWLELRNPQGKLKLKFALLSRINQIFPKVAIRHIYFTNFIMQ